MAKMMRFAAPLAAFAASGGAAFAQVEGQGEGRDGIFPWQMKIQAPVTAIMEYIEWFSWYTIIIMAVICTFVFALIAYAMWKFREQAHPVPSRLTHHTWLEVAWTITPILILVAIAVPSFRLLYGQYDPSHFYADFNPETDKFLTIKVTGYQWYWGVEYQPDEDAQANGVAETVSFDALMIPDADLPENGVRNLSVDNPIVVPVNTFVRVLTTGGDVIHAFAVPPFGIKADSVPGRINEQYFKAEREGIFYGQCSELCGKDHAFMPLAVQVVSQDLFRQWIGEAAGDLAGANQRLAAAIEARDATRLAASATPAASAANP